MAAIHIFIKLWYLITYPLYILVVICLFRLRKNPDFNISFYKFVTSLGCVDLVNMVVMLFSRYLIEWGWWSGRPVFSYPFYEVSRRLASGLVFGTSLGQHLGVFLVAVDRVTQFITPVFYSKLWDNGRLKIAIFLHWFLSFSSSVVFYWEKPLLSLNISENGTTIEFGLSGDISVSFIMHAFVMMLIAFIVLLCYVAIFIKAIVIAIQDHSDTAQHMALNTVIIGFSTSSCLLCFVGFAFLAILETSVFGIDIEGYDTIFQIFGELYTGLNPYCLLVFAKNFRNHFKELYSFKGCGVKVVAQDQNNCEKPIEMKYRRQQLVPRSAQPRVLVI